jgi:hypothetical protein
MSRPRIKNISLLQKYKLRYISRHPVPARGAYHDRHERGAGSGGRGCAENERHRSVRQRRVVLTPRSWRLRWQQYKAHRGERVISRKAIAQGMSDALRCPVCSCALSSTPSHTRPRVQRAPGIPCALCLERREVTGKARAYCAARSRRCVFSSLRAKRSNPSRRKARMDCFVANAPRNDGLGSLKCESTSPPAPPSAGAAYATCQKPP